jgi:hypothetical protein
MNFEFFYYVISRIDQIKEGSGVVALSLGILLLLGGLLLGLFEVEPETHCDEDYFKVALLFYKRSFVIFIISLTIFLFLPSKEECIIYYIMPKIKNNETLINMPDKLIKTFDESIDLLNDKIKRELTEK